MPFAATCMDLEIIILNKSDKDKYHRLFSCGIYLQKKIQINLLANTETYLHILKTNLPFVTNGEM